MYRYKAHPRLSEEKCHRLWAVETFHSMWFVSMQYVELGFFFWRKAACEYFVVVVSSSQPVDFSCVALLLVSPPSHPCQKLSAMHGARCTFGINKCTWRKSVIQYRSRPHVYLLGGTKWLLANALIFVALAECTLHSAVLRGDLTSCVGRGGQEASRQHMQTDPCREV